MKSYTDLEQSRKLAEILSPESADCYWWSSGKRYYIESIDDDDYDEDKDIRAWSLAALLDIIPYAIHKSDNEFYRLGIDKGYNDYAVWYSNNGLTINNLDVTSDNFVDACVEMIIKLHEQNLL